MTTIRVGTTDYTPDSVRFVSGLGYYEQGTTGHGIAGVEVFALPLATGDGAAFRGTRTSQNELTVTALFAPESDEYWEAQANIAAFVAALRSNSITLIEDGRSLPVRYVGGLEGLQQHAGQSISDTYVVQFLADNPYWVGSSTSQDISSGGTLTNDGNADTYPTLTLSGTGSVTSITNSTTSTTLAFDGLEIQTDEIITISLSPTLHTVESSSRGTSVIRYIDGAGLARWRLSPGDNIIAVTAAAGVTIEAAWTPRYWSVD